MDSDAASESNTSQGDLNDSGDENDVLEKCCFNKNVFEVPQSFCDQEEVYKQVLSMHTWENVLNDKHREKLKKFLPTFQENDEEEKTETLKKLFSGENFKFGNPVKNFFERLKDGFMAPDVAEAADALKKANYREYKNQQQHYFYRLLQDILLSRKKLLDAAYTLPPDTPVKMQQFTAKPKDATLCERTRLRYFSILQDLREEIGELDTSSEDENYPESSPPKVTRKHKKQLQILEASLSPEMTRITSTTAPPPGYPGSGHFLNRCLDMIEVSEERYREMLLKYKQRKFTDPHHPELDVSKVDLDDMIARANIAKRPLMKIADSQIKKKVKSQDNLDKVSKAIPPEIEKMLVDIKLPELKLQRPVHHDEVTPVSNGENLNDVQLQVVPETVVKIEKVAIKVEMNDEPSNESRLSPVSEMPSYPCCFFSVLRDLFYEFEQKLSASKLEDKVRAWQDSPIASTYEWSSFMENWSDLVPSSLRFLAGDLISILPENFVPFLDYKEKQQQWQWIGSGRDSEEHLYALCQHWLDNKDDVSLDVLENSQGSPPPPRVTTVWTVRPATDEEKAMYREQERIRYQNPHKAFTFKIHGYESVVGPVKGVYGKESGVNKAREHSLLISDRPPFVTILSLVRDAAARLPNGEGTRADICELLKDSQYLAPANDQQIHTVVSGALDRLHYEKDPCVKYDVNRKLWIYLHRSRTEEEFERIHQAQAAAVKARKAVQKNKTPKLKSKDVPRTPSLANVTLSSESGAAILNVDVTASPTSSTHSPRGGMSPRTQGSPKQSHPSNRHLMRNLSLPCQTSSKTTAAVICENFNSNKKQESTQTNLLTSGLGPSVVPNVAVCSPQHSSSSSILSQFQVEGNNSRPSSQGSVQSLPSPKTVIANVNAAQFVSVSSLQAGTTTAEQTMSSPSISPCIGVLSVDMKPSSPSFVGQPPVLQPVLSHQAMNTTSALTCASSAITSALASSVAGNMSKANKTFGAQSLATTKPVPGFQTIVIKPESGVRTGSGISSLPLLSVEEISSASDSNIINTSPVVARLVHGSQLLSLSNIVPGSASSQLLKQGASAIQNFKIQGSSFTSQVLPNSAINLLPATQISSASDKLTRLALVSQDATSQEGTLISSASVIGPPSLFTVSQDTLPSSECKVSSAMKDMAEIKRIALSQALGSMRPTVPDITHHSESSSSLNHVPPAVASNSAIINSGIKSSTPVVIASQEPLKPLTSTYVMTTPITNASVVAAHQGVRTTSPLNMRALQSIKVIPVPQSLAQNKNIRGGPLFARIITPTSGLSLRSTVPSDLMHAHQLKGNTSVNIVHGLHSVPSSSHIMKTPAQPCANQEVPSSQPFIIQVQAPKSSDEDS